MPRAPRLPRPTPPHPEPPQAKPYRHKQEAAARPDAGAAPRFRAARETATYRYDSSLSPALDWDTNPARDTAEFLLAAIADAAPLPNQTFPAPRELKGADGATLLRIAGLQDAVAALKRLQSPFLNWTGKAERLSFEVSTLPLFVHERLSTEAIVQTLEEHRKRPAQDDLFSLFADPQMPMSAQVNAYAHRNRWVNRMILGDSLSVMNSLSRFENLAGQVQCIYMDPPYGVKFGSNFQPFVRKRDVKNNDDADMTRELEMVQAYRDTWSLGLHSYLTYLRDRLLVARDLLTPSGSIFVQISDENLHHVREVMDEVLGSGNFLVTIILKKMGGTTPTDPVNDYILWYGKNKEATKKRIRPIFQRRKQPEEDAKFNTLIAADGSMARARDLDDSELNKRLTEGWRWARVNYPIVSQHPHPERSKDYIFKGKSFSCGNGAQWRFEVPAAMDRLASAGRLFDGGGASLGGVMFWDDWPYVGISNVWDDLKGEEDPKYVVQTAWKAVQRCLLMTTDPGDLVLDPTCGSGTTALMAEHWGRRWITIDTSRVPLALARERILTATFPWHRLRDEAAGPAGGFVYARRQNRKGEEVGGIVPHMTLKSIANNEPVSEEVLFDRPETDDGITRVSGPFVVEAVLPTPQPLDEPEPTPPEPEPDAPADHIARMIEVLRRSPTLSLPGGGKVTMKGIKRPARSVNLSAEATVDIDASGAAVQLAAAIEAAHEKSTGALPFTARPVAILFGPPDGSITARAVLEAAKEANIKNYAHLYVIGFGFTAEAQAEIDAGEPVLGLPASRVTMTVDVLMGDLLKTQRSSQIFAITGSPDIETIRLDKPAEDGTPRWQIRLLGLDSFDPATMLPHHMNGDDVPMWMLDTAWNGMAFRADQVFFPRTSAWDNLRRALRSTHDDSVWEHLRGNTSAPFAAPEATEIAVKVLDDRGNELLKIARLAS